MPFRIFRKVGGICLINSKRHGTFLDALDLLGGQALFPALDVGPAVAPDPASDVLLDRIIRPRVLGHDSLRGLRVVQTQAPKEVTKGRERILGEVFVPDEGWWTVDATCAWLGTSDDYVPFFETGDGAMRIVSVGAPGI